MTVPRHLPVVMMARALLIESMQPKTVDEMWRERMARPMPPHAGWDWLVKVGGLKNTTLTKADREVLAWQRERERG
jgi:hypothetical protein